MDLVIVYLTDIREYVIVPERYIYGLDVKQLKNSGKNSCRDHLVFWSDKCIEGEFYPEPIFSSDISNAFPAGN